MLFGEIEINLDQDWFATSTDSKDRTLIYEYVDEYFYYRDIR